MIYTLDAAAKLLGKHPKTISRYVKKGLIKAKKIEGSNTNGNRYLITEESIKEFLGEK